MRVFRTARFLGISLLFAAPTVWAQETAPSAGAPSLLEGSDPRFAAPSGPLGAGLSLSPEQRARLYVELGFGRLSSSLSLFGVDVELHATSLSLLLGGGYKLTPNLELEAMLPIVWGEVGTSVSGPAGRSSSDSGFAVANAHVGLSYLHGRGPLRLKIGGALEYGPWTSGIDDPGPRAGVGLANGARGGQDLGLWSPEVFSIIAPGRIEYGGRLVLSGDVALGVHVPTNSADTELSVQLSPGVGFYASETALLGLRLPFIFIPTEGGDGSTQLAAQPYARFDFGSGFVNLAFTLNLDDPLGFSFDDGKVWGVLVGGGGTF